VRRDSAIAPTDLAVILARVLVDEFLPVYDVSDSVATVVDADPQTVWDALMDVDLIEVGRRKPLVGVLGALRMLPEIASHLLHGERPPAAPSACGCAIPPRRRPSRAAGCCSASAPPTSSRSGWWASSGGR